MRVRDRQRSKPGAQIGLQIDVPVDVVPVQWDGRLAFWQASTNTIFFAEACLVRDVIAEPEPVVAEVEA